MNLRRNSRRRSTPRKRPRSSRARCTSTISRCASRRTNRRSPKPTCAARSAIREILEARFPSYGFYGEETGSHDADAENLWLVDPIDGTKAFVREYPMFSTQIALMRGGEIVLGVSSAPVYGELAYAERGCGRLLSTASAISVSRISDAARLRRFLRAT